MQDMISFSLAMLDALADFLGAAPIIYLFGLICLCFVVKALKTLF